VVAKGARVLKRPMLVGAAVVLMSVPVLAQSSSTTAEAPWSVESAKTVGAGRTVLWGQAGWPGIWAELIHGLEPTLEIGGKVAFNYGFEGIVDLGVLGLDFQFLLRKQFFENEKMRIAARFDPGILLYFPSRSTLFGITFPVGVEFGFPVSPVVSLSASFGLPMYVYFQNGGSGFVIPILFGGGAEYLLEKNVALTFKLALGPSIATAGGYAATAFTLYAQFGAAYKFN
jgi:hypothetical protein